jgi:hypothetical protein
LASPANLKRSWFFSPNAQCEQIAAFGFRARMPIGALYRLPVGLQIVGRHRDEWSALQLAHGFEQATRHGDRRPSRLD